MRTTLYIYEWWGTLAGVGGAGRVESGRQDRGGVR